MSRSQLKSGDRVLVTTDSLCQYEGFFRSLNRHEATFSLSNVRALGSKDGRIASSKKVYGCVKFELAKIVTMLALDDGDQDRMSADPAIVSVNNAFYRESGPRAYFETTNQNTRYQSNHNQFRNREYHDGREQSYGSRRTSFQSHRLPSNRTKFDSQSSRPAWQGRTQSEGSFPQQHPGQRKNLGDFDIDEGLEEFSRLKLSNSGDEADKDKETKEPKKYNKASSFFDGLKLDAQLEKPVIKSISPKGKQLTQNIETFGEETVRALNFHKRPSYKPSGYRQGSRFGAHLGPRRMNQNRDNRIYH